MKRKRLVFIALGAGALGYGIGTTVKSRQGTLREDGHCRIRERGPPEVVEVETEGLDAGGNFMVDDLIVAVDSDGKIVATDETVAVFTPEGDTVIDEKLSVVGEDGELHTVEEDIAVTEVDEVASEALRRR